MGFKAMVVSLLKNSTPVNIKAGKKRRKTTTFSINRMKKMKRLQLVWKYFFCGFGLDI